MTVRSPALAVSEAPGERAGIRELLPTGSRGMLVVAVGAVLAAASLVEFGFTWQGLVGVVLCPVLLLLAAIDFEHRLLPNAIVFPAVPLVAVIVAVGAPGDFLRHLAAAAALGGFFFASAVIFPGSIGMGDVKLGFLLGLALAGRVLPALMIALAVLLVVALWLLVTRGLAARKQAIPFGPFLALGGILGFFLG